MNHMKVFSIILLNSHCHQFYLFVVLLRSHEFILVLLKFHVLKWKIIDLVNLNLIKISILHISRHYVLYGKFLTDLFMEKKSSLRSVKECSVASQSKEDMPTDNLAISFDSNDSFEYEYPKLNEISPISLSKGIYHA